VVSEQVKGTGNATIRVPGTLRVTGTETKRVGVPSNTVDSAVWLDLNLPRLVCPQLFSQNTSQEEALRKDAAGPPWICWRNTPTAAEMSAAVATGATTTQQPPR